MEMKLYKLKHIPTGLFFTPSKGCGNLSTTGKIYINRIPDLKWCETIRVKFYTDKKSKKNDKLIECFKIEIKNYIVDIHFKTSPEDWEIIEIKND